jgi:hypothetical protein
MDATAILAVWRDRNDAVSPVTTRYDADAYGGIPTAIVRYKLSIPATTSINSPNATPVSPLVVYRRVCSVSITYPLYKQLQPLHGCLPIRATTLSNVHVTITC